MDSPVRQPKLPIRAAASTLWNLDKLFHLSELQFPPRKMGIMPTPWGGRQINCNNPCKAFQVTYSKCLEHRHSYFLLRKEVGP